MLCYSCGVSLFGNYYPERKPEAYLDAAWIFSSFIDTAACHVCGGLGHKRRNCPNRSHESTKKRYHQLTENGLLQLCFGLATVSAFFSTFALIHSYWHSFIVDITVMASVTNAQSLVNKLWSVSWYYWLHHWPRGKKVSLIHCFIVLEILLLWLRILKSELLTFS